MGDVPAAAANEAEDNIEEVEENGTEHPVLINVVCMSEDYQYVEMEIEDAPLLANLQQEFRRCTGDERDFFFRIDGRLIMNDDSAADIGVHNGVIIVAEVLF